MSNSEICAQEHRVTRPYPEPRAKSRVARGRMCVWHTQQHGLAWFRAADDENSSTYRSVLAFGSEHAPPSLQHVPCGQSLFGVVDVLSL